MDAAEVSTLVAQGLPDCRIDVVGDGGRFQVTAIGEVFAGLSAVKRQQTVYRTLTEVIASGAVHAVTIIAKTPDEFAGG